MYPLDEFIKDIRELDKHMVDMFTMGGCYKFAVMLQKYFGGCIYLVRDYVGEYIHAVVRLNGVYYDIRGKYEPHMDLDGSTVDMVPITELESDDIDDIASWTFGDRYRFRGVCEYCGELGVPCESV